MKWLSDWPVMGIDLDGDGTGEPVAKFQKPNVGKSFPIATPPDSDEFNDSRLGLQWQWHANPQSNWGFSSSAYGFLRLFNVPLPEDFRNFWDVPNLWLQKFPAPSFTATTKLTFTARADNEKAGMIVMGLNYAYVSVTKKPNGLYVTQTVCTDADKQSLEKETPGVLLPANTFYLRVRVNEGAVCSFGYSIDGKNYSAIGNSFTARQGRWIGAKVGLFAVGPGDTSEMGYADFDWFRVE
jgi:beta-xylosidase